MKLLVLNAKQAITQSMEDAWTVMNSYKGALIATLPLVTNVLTVTSTKTELADPVQTTLLNVLSVQTRVTNVSLVV